jgi:hypothetical protein
MPIQCSRVAIRRTNAFTKKWRPEQVIAKSTAIKGRGGKSGGRAVKAIGLASGGDKAVPCPSL